ncbi:hypothetical protein EWB00_006721, partial [Schistosoma japonicum]
MGARGKSFLNFPQHNWKTFFAICTLTAEKCSWLFKYSTPSVPATHACLQKKFLK